MNNNSYYKASRIVTSTFFLWGLSYGVLDVLNKYFQETMFISKAQSGLLQCAYFSAYFVSAVPASIINRRFGYKYGLVIGLLAFANGAILFVPALICNSYYFFLGALFVLASGLATLEATANPYMVTLGNLENSDMRLNIAQSFCGLGATLGPLIGGLLLLDGGVRQHDNLLIFYVTLAMLVVAAATFISKADIPEVSDTSSATRTDISPKHGLKIFVGGIVAQFFYVAAQVGVGALFINYAVESWPELTSQQGAWLLSISMFLFMIGRFTSIFFMRWINSHRLLLGYAFMCMLLSIPIIFSPSKIAVVCLIGLFFFMSIMFPAIFSTAIRYGTGDFKNRGAIMMMSMIGGAVYPYLMGHLSDIYGTAYAFILPLSSFLIITFYGIYTNQLIKPVPSPYRLECR